MLIWQSKVLFLVQGRTVITDEALSAIGDDLVVGPTLPDSHNLLVLFAHSAIVVSDHGGNFGGSVMMRIHYLQFLL